MIPSMRAIHCVILYSILLAGWTSGAQLDLNEGDNHKEILLKRGDLLVVHLPSNGSTGYSWSVVNSLPGKLQGLGKPTLQQSNKSGGRSLIGAGGIEAWRFRAVVPGQTTLTFSYARAWEKEVPPARVIAWPVTILP